MFVLLIPKPEKEPVQIKTTLIDHMGNDLTVVNAARVSFAKHHNEMLEGDDKLISYLAKHKHMSPFGHCFASFHVKAPIFVARQLVKHKFLRWNEISRRYVDSEPEFYFPNEWRMKSKDKKQGSSDEVVDISSLDGAMHYSYTDIINLYNDLLIMNVAPEQARMVLPINMFTEWYWSGSLDAFAAMCNLRLKDDTQLETRLIAESISNKMEECFPLSWKALMENVD